MRFPCTLPVVLDGARRQPERAQQGEGCFEPCAPREAGWARVPSLLMRSAAGVRHRVAPPTGPYPRWADLRRLPAAPCPGRRRDGDWEGTTTPPPPGTGAGACLPPRRVRTPRRCRRTGFVVLRGSTAASSVT